MDERAVVMKGTHQLPPLFPQSQPGVGGGKPQPRAAEYQGLSEREKQNLMDYNNIT